MSSFDDIAGEGAAFEISRTLDEQIPADGSRGAVMIVFRRDSSEVAAISNLSLAEWVPVVRRFLEAAE